MSRIDDLFEQAIASGEVPAAASEAERAELERLLAARTALLGARGPVDREAATSLPVAQARFERFVAAQRQPAAPRVAIASPQPGILSRLLGRHRGLMLSGAAVAIGLLAVLSLFGWQALSSSTNTASAQALYPDDYVQVQGTVKGVSAEGGARLISLETPAGPVDLTISNDTSVVDEQAASDAAAIKVGDQLLVGGVAVNSHTVVAHTIALSGSPAAAPKPAKLKLLARLASRLQGRVLMLTISKDNSQARILVETANGERYLVNIDIAAAEELLQRSSPALGTTIQVNPGANPSAAVFSVSILSPAPGAGKTTTPNKVSSSPAAGSAARPDAGQTIGRATFVTIRGIVSGRQGSLLQVDTVDGTLPVQVRAQTRRLLGASGLTRADIGNPDAVIGHTVTVTGGLDAKTGRVIADLIVVGPKVR